MELALSSFACFANLAMWSAFWPGATFWCRCQPSHATCSFLKLRTRGRCGSPLTISGMRIGPIRPMRHSHLDVLSRSLEGGHIWANPRPILVRFARPPLELLRHWSWVPRHWACGAWTRGAPLRGDAPRRVEETGVAPVLGWIRLSNDTCHESSARRLKAGLSRAGRKAGLPIGCHPRAEAPRNTELLELSLG